MRVSKKYFSDDKYYNCHIRKGKLSGVCGTLRYASVNAHMHSQLSRRDDIESILYLVIFLIKFKLPWSSIDFKNMGREQIAEVIKESKLNTPEEIVCKGLPVQLTEILKYIRRLNFKEQPSYLNIRKLLLSILDDQIMYDSVGKAIPYEWNSSKATPNLTSLFQVLSLTSPRSHISSSPITDLPNHLPPVTCRSYSRRSRTPRSVSPLPEDPSTLHLPVTYRTAMSFPGFSHVRIKPRFMIKHTVTFEHKNKFKVAKPDCLIIQDISQN